MVKLNKIYTRSGDNGTLEQVFRKVTHAEDPVIKAREVLGRA